MKNPTDFHKTIETVTNRRLIRLGKYETSKTIIKFI